MANHTDKHIVTVQPSADNRAGAQPSGQKGDNPATAGSSSTGAPSGTPENRLGHLNPFSPEDANTTPGTTGEK